MIFASFKVVPCPLYHSSSFLLSVTSFHFLHSCSFQCWEPLQYNLHSLKVKKFWQRLFKGNEPHDDGIYIEAELSSSTPFTQLFTEVIIPEVRIAHHPEAMLHF